MEKGTYARGEDLDLECFGLVGGVLGIMLVLSAMLSARLLGAVQQNHLLKT